MKANAYANEPRRTSACLLETYQISDAALAAYLANPPRHRRRNTVAPSTPEQEERAILAGRTWPDWTAPEGIAR